MGLFSGFSIISSVEIFFLAKFLFKMVAHCRDRLLDQNVVNNDDNNQTGNREITRMSKTTDNTTV